MTFSLFVVASRLLHSGQPYSAVAHFTAEFALNLQLTTFYQRLQPSHDKGVAVFDYVVWPAYQSLPHNFPDILPLVRHLRHQSGVEEGNGCRYKYVTFDD